MSQEHLVEAVRARRALVVAGAGVSMATVTEAVRPQISWSGLIKTGIEYVKTNVDSSDEAWESWITSDLKQTENVSDALIMAAQKLKNKLPVGHFSGWLRESLGGLEVDNAQLIQAIEKLNAPIATTNYDTLVESVTGRGSTNWMDPAGMQRALLLRTQDVMHLHGIWKYPDSVIFSSESYGSIKSNGSAQLIQSAAATANTMIFIGAGATLVDPNLGQLLSWIQSAIPESENFHYLLCVDSELSEFQKKYAGTCIQPVAYGSGHLELAGFVERLAADCWGKDATVDILKQNTVSLNAMADRVKAEVLISSHAGRSDAMAIEELLIPPVLLPAAHEDMIKNADDKAIGGRSRSDARNDARQLSGMLIVGEETSGLTSALEWVVHERARAVGDSIPVIVDFSHFGKGQRPLERAIRRELNEMDIAVPPNSPLPKVAVAIDNVISTQNLASDVHRQFERMVKELEDKQIESFVIGCRPGAEFDIAEALPSTAATVSKRYIGQVTYGDAKRMAKLVAPTRADELASRAFSIINRECLSRTPMTMALLFDVLLRGEVTLATASDTALLDAYVSLLLGRGNPYDDARFSLDSKEREAILASLAEEFVRESAGSMSQSDTIACFENLFEEVGWNDVPTEILENLRSRHILSFSGGQVKFTQTSFLHLFAAKRATESPEFLSFVLARPLYYAPIIAHYAALTRNDESVLKQVGALVGVHIGVTSRGAPIFSEYDDSEPVLQSDDLETFARALDDSREENTTDQVEPARADEDIDDGYYDANDVVPERAPYPASNIDDAPPMMKAISALSLVSNVLRDSELVRNVDLKTSILSDALIVWGRLVHILDTDKSLKGVADELANGLADDLEISKSKRDEFVFSLASTVGISIGIGSMSSNLASRKLLKSLDRCFEDSSFLADVGAVVMGAMLAYETGAEDWPVKFLQAQQHFGGTLAVYMVFWKYSMRRYLYDGTLKNESLSALEEFMCAREIKRHGLAQDSEVRAKKVEILSGMRKSRALALAEKSARSKMALTRARSVESRDSH